MRCVIYSRMTDHPVLGINMNIFKFGQEVLVVFIETRRREGILIIVEL